MRGVGLAGVGGALRGEPGDDVGDLLVGHSGWRRQSERQSGMSSVGLAGDDDAAQILVADEREIGRIDDGAELAGAGLRIAGLPSPVGAVAAGAEGGVGLLAVGSDRRAELAR